jgi:uncharacterized protein (UPF0335 family)
LSSIKEETKLFLTINFDANDIDIKFTQEMTRDLYFHLGIENQSQLNLAKEEIRSGFISFFDINIHIAILFKEMENIVVRINSEVFYKIKTKQRINKFIFDNKEIILNNETEDGLEIPDFLVEDILDSIYENEEKCDLDYYHILRNVLIDSFSLEPKDMIFIGSDYIKIKYFNKVKDKYRAEDIAGDELKKLEEEYFGNNTQKIIQDSIKHLVYDEEIFSKLHMNDFFDRHINIIKVALVKKISEEVQSKGFQFNLFTNYIFRKNYDYIYKEFSYYLLHHEKEEELDKVVSFFTGNTVIDKNGKKYRIPELIDNEKTKWNAIGIKATLRNYNNFKDKYKYSISDLKENLKDLINKISVLQKELKTINDDLTSMTIEINRGNDVLSKIQNEKYEAEIKAKKSIINKKSNNAKVESLKIRYTNKFQAVKKITSDKEILMNDNLSIKNDLEKLNAEKTTYQSDIKKQENDMKSRGYKMILNKYNCVVHALENALKSKKRFL